MKTLSEWLQRQAPRPKPKKPLKRTQKPRPMSPKRQRESRLYTQKRKAFLEAHQLCEMPWWLRSNESTGLHLTEVRSVDIHHSAGRLNGNYLNESTWLPVCRSCHDWIHAHPKEARELGLLV